MILLVEVDKLKIPLPIPGSMVVPILCRYTGWDRDSAHDLWEALRQTSAKFPNWVLVEADTADGEHIRVSIFKNCISPLAKRKNLCYTEKK